MAILHTEMERDRQQKKCLHFSSGFGFFSLLLSPTYRLPRPQKAICKRYAPKAGSGSAGGGKGTCPPTEQHIMSRTQKTSPPKNHQKHLRHSKTRQNYPISKSHVYLPRVKLAPVQRNQHMSESCPWQISIIPLKPILLAQHM